MPPKKSLRSVPSKNRRKPFSNKQKKLQLQQKRQRKRDKDDGKHQLRKMNCCSMCVLVDTPTTVSAEDGGDERGEGSSTETGSEGEAATAVEVARLNIQPPTERDTQYDPNRCLNREKRHAVLVTSPSLSLHSLFLCPGISSISRESRRRR